MWYECSRYTCTTQEAEGDMTTFDPDVVAGPLNADIFWLTVFAAGRWWRQPLESRLT